MACGRLDDQREDENSINSVLIWDFLLNEKILKYLKGIKNVLRSKSIFIINIFV